MLALTTSMPSYIVVVCTMSDLLTIRAIESDQMYNEEWQDPTGKVRRAVLSKTYAITSFGIVGPRAPGCLTYFLFAFHDNVRVGVYR